MTENGLPTSDEPVPSVVTLQSKDHEEILDAIDQLRAEGISKYLNLPQLIVCGDQSSGKSSVLEAISGLGFPSKDNLCTRFATELILRRSNQAGVSVTIQPDENRPLAEIEAIRQFRSPTVALENFAAIVRSAEEVMGVNQSTRGFFKDVLRVEVTGPRQPHLTLVDLPGLYHAPDDNQDDEGVELVEALVSSYMRNERSIILAVISAKSDLALQKVTAFTRKIDPERERTLGIITKPDTLPKGSDMELSFVKLAKNERVSFRLGWHVLKNREFHERDFSIAQRHRSEADFFSQGIWTNLPTKQMGIDTLQVRLSTILKDLIISQLPGLEAEALLELQTTKSSLQKLGDARSDLDDQRRYLLYASERFTALIGNATNGFYLDPFFGNAMEDEGYLRRLRAVVQNRLLEFADTMRDRGEQRKIFDDWGDMSPRDLKKNEVWRSDLVEEVQTRVRRSRGRELPGTFNPLIIGDLFYLQSKPWEALVRHSSELLLEDTRQALLRTLEAVADENTVEGLLQHIISPALARVEGSLQSKTAELLKPHQEGHPITCNHYFTENVQKAREAHLRRSVVDRLKEFFGDDVDMHSLTKRTYSFSMGSLIAALGNQTEADMDRFSCSEAIDCMQAYYKVAIKKFVDDFSVLAVEKCLLEPLLDIFSPKLVEALDEQLVQSIAEETEELQLERTRLNEKLRTLQKALSDLRRLDRHKLSESFRRNAAHKADSKEDDDSEESAEIGSVDGSISVQNSAAVEDGWGVPPVADSEPADEVEIVPHSIEAPAEDTWGFGSPSKERKKGKKHQKGGFVF